MADEFAGLRRCGTDQPSTGDRQRIADFEAALVGTVPEAALDIVVPVTFIHVTNGADGQVSPERRQKQIDVLNKAYEPHGVRFTFDEGATRFVDNAQFFTMGHKSLAERTCKRQNQAVDPAAGLNLYTAAPGGGLLGWATFPYEMAGDPESDGVVVLHTSLPEGPKPPYNLGMTAVHEIGHWLGLYHTFQDGCFGLGDEVADTAAHSGPNYEKPADSGQPYNLCPAAPAGSECPIHNYMNYVDDDWMWEFTPGQRARIAAQVTLFRSGLLGSVASLVEADSGFSVKW